MPDKSNQALHVAVLVAGGLYVGLTPLLNPYGSVPLYDLKRILEVALLIAAGASVALIPFARSSWLSTWRSFSILDRTLLLAVVVVGLASAILSANVQMGVLEVVHLALMAVFALLVASSVQRHARRASQILAWTLFIAAGIYTFWFVRDYLFSQLGLAYSFRRGQINALWPNGEFLGYAHPRFFNQVQTMLIPILALPALWGDRRSYPARYLMILVVMFWWTMTFASGSRGTIVSCGIAFIATAPFFLRSSLRYYALNLVAVAGGLALFFLLFKVLGEAPESIDQRNITTSSERFNLWRHAFGLFLSNPVFGAGPMQYASNHATWGVHPHNALLQLLSEWGGIATAIVIVLGIRGLSSFVRLARDVNDEVGPSTKAAVATAALAALVHAMLSGVIVMPASQVTLLLILGWSVGLSLGSIRAQEKVADARKWSLNAVIISGVMLLMIVAEAHVTIDSFEKSYRLRESSVQNAPEHKRLPRFWLWGCINDYEATTLDEAETNPVAAPLTRKLQLP